MEMTENKRFIIDDVGTLIDIQTRNTYDYVSDVCPLLNALNEENEQLKQHNQQITKILEDGGVILTKNQLISIIKMNDDSVKVRHLKIANAKLKDEIGALREYIQKKEL